MGPKNLPPHEAAKLEGGREARPGLSYETIADKVGLVPNLRLKDNVLQGVVCGVFALVGALSGLAVGGGLQGFWIGAFLGLVIGVLLSGGVLLVIGRFCR